MSNIVNLPPNSHDGIYKGFLHKDGGIQSILENGKKLEIEKDEFHLCSAVLQSEKTYEFKNATNKEILTKLFQDSSCIFEQGKSNFNDFIICRLVVLDDKKRNLTGNAKEIINILQSEKSCKVTEDAKEEFKKELGGSVSEDKELYKLLEKKEKLGERLLEEKLKVNKVLNGIGWGAGMRRTKVSASTTKEDEIKNKIKEIDEKINLITGKTDSKNKIDEVNNLIREISTYDAGLNENIKDEYEEKYSKLISFDESEVLKEIREYIKFQKDNFKFIATEKNKKNLENWLNSLIKLEDRLIKSYKNKKNNLKKGIKVEEEHRDTVEKLAKGEITAEEGVKEIAKAHLAEDPKYYEKLEEVENPFGRFIEIVKSSKDFYDAFSKVKKIKDVPSFVADEFSAKYNPDGKLSMEKAFKVLYDKYKNEGVDEGVISQKQELQDLIDLFKEAVKENPNDQESKDLLELYEENLKEFDTKLESGGSINRKLTYLGEVGGDKIGQKSSLEKAKSLEKQGVSSEEIRQETGWFVNPHDKKWRFEISDEDFEIIYDFEDAKKYFNENKDKTFFKKKLSDVIGHDKLFLAYPEFKNVTFYFFNQKNAKLAGVFIPENKEKEIFIIYNIYDEKSRIEHARGVKSTKSTNETWVSHILRISDVISGGSGLNYRPISNDVYKFRRNIIAHELQHLVQIREEFGAGSSSEWWYKEIIRKRGIDESKLSEIERNNLRIDSKLYSKNSSGEIEARDIDLRLDFNDKERKGIIPLSLVIVNPDYVTVDIEENRFKQGGELNAEESILNAPCINKKFKFVESSDFNEYRKGGIISGLKGLFNSKDDDIDYEKIRDSVSDTIKKIAEKHNGTVNYILDKKDGGTSLDFNFHTPEDKYNFTQELNKFNNETLRLEKGGSINNMTKEELKAFYNTKEGKELDRQTHAKWKKLVNMSKSELETFYNSEEGKEAGLSASEAKELGIDSGRESARWIMKMKDIPYTEWTSDMWRWAKKQIRFISRMSGVKGDLYDDNGNKTPKYKSLMIWGNNPEKYEDGGKIEVNKVSVYQTNFSGLYFSDLGGYFESHFTDVFDLEDENVILKDAPIFLFFKNPYDIRYSSKISIDDVIGAVIPKKMEKDARTIFDKRFISYVTYSDDATNEDKIEAIKKLVDINEDIILK